MGYQESHYNWGGPLVHMKLSSSCTTSGVRRVINSDIPSSFEINFYFDLYIFGVNMSSIYLT
jgi:hypothetical protein